MNNICAIGEKKIVNGLLCEKRKATRFCSGCEFRDWKKCSLTGETRKAVEDGGAECNAGETETIWVKVAEVTPPLIAVACERPPPEIVRHGLKRRCLQSMIVGQTSAFFPKDGEEHGIYQAANERWIKDAGWKFSIETGCFVSQADMSSRKYILITRTA